MKSIKTSGVSVEVLEEGLGEGRHLVSCRGKLVMFDHIFCPSSQ